LVAGVRSAFASDEVVSDELLADRVRARLLRIGVPAGPGGRVEVTSRERRVALRGAVPAGAHARIVGQVARVRGVREVIDLLELKPGPGP
ncbi:MAG TPA: BON domain-containing protein, partial [Anaeromyxobacteraceae bacterium]|nr:BON domain-containing protein [Anaeromyxobacteraceae bacterium]